MDVSIDEPEIHDITGNEVTTSTFRKIQESSERGEGLLVDSLGYC